MPRGTRIKNERNRLSQSTDITLSIFLHSLLVLFVLLFSTYKDTKKEIKPYFVSIIESSESIISSQDIRAEHPKGVTTMPEKRGQKKDSKVPIKPKSSRGDDDLLKERMAALEVKKRIEEIASLKKKLVEINKESVIKGQGSNISQESGMKNNDYYSMVMNKIRDNWVYPESIDKDLLTIVIIKIAKDGSISINRIEKRSGNVLFDRSVLMAINRSSPLPPPKEEIEIGIRFMP